METAGLILYSWIGIVKTYWVYILLILIVDVYVLHSTKMRLRKMKKMLLFSLAVESVLLVVVPLVGIILIGG